MKRLKFKKWVSVTLCFILTIALMLLCTVEFKDFIHEMLFGITCISIIIINSILLNIFS